MSFSKARIQRFNELTSEAPPPGAYDPKFDVKTKSRPVFEKKVTTGRLNDAKSTTSSASECNASVSSKTTSNASAKQFRTPQQLPKKRAVVKPNGHSCPRAKSKLYEESKSSQARYEPQQELADLKIECVNKDKTIFEYEKLIEEMKIEIQTLNEKYNNLQEKHTQAEEQHRKDFETMFQLPCTLLGQEIETCIESDCEVTLKPEINNIEDELDSHGKEDEIVNKMMKLEAATEELDKITQELNEELSLKDIQIADLLKLQSETENKLENLQKQLKKSEEQVIDLKADLESMHNQNNSQVLTINKKLIEEMTNVLQDYFDFHNCDGKWNINNITFHPDIEEFLKKIKQFVTDLKMNYEQEIEFSRDNFNEERENLEQELEVKKVLIINLENKLAETNETNAFLTEELKDVQKLYKDLNRNMHEIKMELDNANEKYSEAVEAHRVELELCKQSHLEEQTKLKKLIEETRKVYLQELDSITSERNEELLEIKQLMAKRIEDEKKRMKDCANKMVENAEAVTRETLSACRAESEERIRRVIAETDAKISLFKKASEEEIRLATEKYNTRLDQLEKEKAALNSDLTQRDLEIIQLNATLEEMKRTVETQESFSQSLQDELDRVEAELVEKKDELRNLKDQIRKESAELVARKRRLDVVMAENQASVAAITRRLAESEAEVERLQQELQTKESSLNGCFELLDNITHKSKLVQDKLNSITDDVNERTELINQMEIQCVNDINEAKITFSEKIENLKSVTINELKNLQEKCKEKSEQNTELKVNLKLMSDKLGEVTDMLLKLEEINDEQTIDISKLQLQNAKLQQHLEDKSQTMKDHQTSFEMKLTHYKTENNELKEQISRLKMETKEIETKKYELEEKKYNFEELKIEYDDQIKNLKENLESEKLEREKLEKQVKHYEKTIERMNEESKKIVGKHTTATENNHKQKAKHILQLKERINVQQMDLLRLRQELDSSNNIIDELRQTNEKLKVEAHNQFGVGKENIHAVSSPHKLLFPKSANTTPISSPHKPHTPLRDRNE